jgi:hypothetical protein
MEIKIITGDIRIREFQIELGQKVWPEFMQHDFNVNENWPGLYTHFLKLQFALFDNQTIIGIGNLVPLYWKGLFSELPDTGLDWAMIEAIKNFHAGIKPNLLIGVQILVNPIYRNLGISGKMIQHMKVIAKSNDIDNIALPVRPILKCQYPLIPFENYINWLNKDNQPFDPWIRVHVKTGGKIAGICSRSMFISGSVSDWEKWSGLEIPESGDYVVDKALVPVKIDKDKNIGTYEEPNVWIVHMLKEN